MHFKIKSALACALWIVVCCFSTSVSASVIKVSIAGTPVELPAPPKMLDNSLFVLASMVGTLGAKVGVKGKVKHDQQKVEIISATGDRFHLQGRIIGGSLMLPVSDLASKLGLSADWDEKANQLTIRAFIRHILYDGSQLEIDTGCPVTYDVSWWKSANRLIVDLHGAKLAKGAGFPIDVSVDARVRTAMRDADVLRVVLEVGRMVPYKIVSKPKTNKVQVSMDSNAVVSIEPASNDQPDVVKSPEPGTVIDTAPAIPAIVPPAVVTGIECRDVSSRKVDVMLTFSRHIDDADIKTSMFHQPDRFVLDLSNATFDKKLGDVDVNNAVVNAVRLGKKDDKSARIVFDLPRVVSYDIHDGDAPEQLVVTLELPRGASGKLAGKVVVVDPGHGGAQPGAAGNGCFEKEYTLDIALELQKALADAGVSVIMTRKTDVEVGLQERADIAQRHSADFFISIHNNSCAVPGALSGIETFYHGGDANAQALAGSIQSRVTKAAGLPDLQIKSDYRVSPRIGFHVLRACSGYSIPAVLVEVGFINHPTDAAKLADPDFRTSIAQAIVQGLKDYVEGSNE